MAPREQGSAAVLLRKIRVALTPQGAPLRCVLANGAIVIGQNKRGYGGRGVFIYRDAIEPDLSPLTETIVQPGDVFIDIGANTGIYSLSAAKRVGPQGVVVSVEPNIHIGSWLQRSIEANQFANVRVRSCAVSSEVGIAQLFLNYGKPNSFSLKSHDTNAGSVSVSTITLDELVARERLTKVDFVKIDAEGAERDILEGGAATIDRYRPIILVEISIEDFERLPGGYQRLSLPGSPNAVLVPGGSAAIDKLELLGYRRR